KDYLKIDFSDEDTLIESLITSARQKCERLLGLCIVESEISSLYENDGDMVELAYSNIKKDTTGNYIVNGDYTLSGSDLQKWIKTSDKEIDITYTSGFDIIPQWAKLGILK